MEKVTKKELQQKINILQSKNITNRNLIFRIKRALASIDIDIMSDDFDTTDKPKLKQLDQSVFNGLDAKWRFAAVLADGKGLFFDKKPYGFCEISGYFFFHGNYKAGFVGNNFDTTDWQNSLIERDKVELTDDEQRNLISAWQQSESFDDVIVEAQHSQNVRQGI